MPGLKQVGQTSLSSSITGGRGTQGRKKLSTEVKRAEFARITCRVRRGKGKRRGRGVGFDERQNRGACAKRQHRGALRILFRVEIVMEGIGLHGFTLTEKGINHKLQVRNAMEKKRMGKPDQKKDCHRCSARRAPAKLFPTNEPGRAMGRKG